MMFRYSNVLLCIVSVFLLTGCKDDNGVLPPFTFTCFVRLVDSDGNSVLQENKDKLGEVKVSLPDAADEKRVVDVSYSKTDDHLAIQVFEWRESLKNNGNYDQEYVVQIQYPDIIRNQKDTIKVKFRFRDGVPSVVEASYNEEKPQLTYDTSVVFEIENGAE